MVGIKDIDMPVGCCEWHEDDENSPVFCPLYDSCRKRETIRVNMRPNECPLVEIEVKEGK